MRRRILCVLAAVLMILGNSAVAEGTANEGSITVDWGEISGSVTLFKVGTPVSGGYTLGQEFGGGIITRKDVASQALAQWLCEHVQYEGWTLPAGDRAVAEFGNLEAGLYLIVQNGAPEGYYPFLPLLVELPWEGQWNVLAKPKMERYPSGIPLTGEGRGLYFGFFGMILSGVSLVLLAQKRKKP